MSETSFILLLGVGGSGCTAVRQITQSFPHEIRSLLIDTDASVATEGENFLLLGGNRLAGHGTGGDVTTAQMAAQDSLEALEKHLSGVRLVFLVTSLGGGTGGGATIEIIRHLAELDIQSVVFATTPFVFESEDRQRNARGVISMITAASHATFLLPLDDLVEGEDQMTKALAQASQTLAEAVTLVWRLLETPGYLRLDVTHLLRLLEHGGRGRFATAHAQGPQRVEKILEDLAQSRLLTVGSGPIRAILCGILAGEDLRLSEIGALATGLRRTFGETATFELSTVNDEATFSGQLAVTVMLFESSENAVTLEKKTEKATERPKKRTPTKAHLNNTYDRFANTEKTLWQGEDLDVPTFIRRNIWLES